MNRTKDPFELVRVGNPVPDPSTLPDSETPAGQDLLVSILGELPQEKATASDNVHVFSPAGVRKQGRGSRRLAVFAVSFIAVLLVGSVSVLFLSTSPEENPTGPASPSQTTAPEDAMEQTAPTSTPASPSMTVYVLEMDGFEPNGADVHHELDGTAVSFGWTNNSQTVNITTFKPFSEDSPKAEAIGTPAPNPTRADTLNFNGTKVDYSYHAENDIHTFIWWDDGAVSRLTAQSFGEDTPDVLASLTEHDLTDQIITEMIDAPVWTPVVYLLDRPGMAFDGGEITQNSARTVVGLSWRDVNIHVSVVTVGPIDQDTAEWTDFAEPPGLDYSEETITFGGQNVAHYHETQTDTHTYLWWEDQTGVRVTVENLPPEGPPILEDLNRTSLDAAEELIDQGSTIGVPPLIAVAMDSPIASLLTQSGRELSAAASWEEDGLPFESATFSDGTGIVELIWQEWPATVNFHDVLTEDTTIEEQDGLQITVRQHPEDNMIEVGIFDGSVYTRAYTTFTNDLNESNVRQLAQMLYDAVSDFMAGE